MKWFLSLLFACALSTVARAQDSPFRKELTRADLSGTNMEVITSINEIPPGQSSRCTSSRRGSVLRARARDDRIA